MAMSAYRPGLYRCIPIAICWTFLSRVVIATAGSPVAVSPGGEETSLVAASGCPTFSWGAADGAASDFEVVVYAVAEDGSLGPTSALRARLPRGTSSWTPSADRCLPAGRYVWTVRAVGPPEDLTLWASPRLFQVVDTAGIEFERAVERVLERWFAEGRVPNRKHDVAAASAAADPMSRASEPSGGSLTPELSDATSSSPSFIADTSLYNPPDCSEGNQMFSDVPFGDSKCEFVQQFAGDQIATACGADPDGGGPLLPPFCPDNPVTRGQLAVYVERAMRGTTTWNVNADQLDGLDSTAFLKLAGGSMAGNLDLSANLITNIGAWSTDFTPGGGLDLESRLNAGDTITTFADLYVASPGGTLRMRDGDGNFDGVFDVSILNNNQTYTFPNASGEVSLLGQSIEASEIANVQRSVSIPLASFIECTSYPGAPLDFLSDLDRVPDFAAYSSFVAIIFDDDPNYEDESADICAELMVPADYVSGGSLQIRTTKDANTAASEFLNCGGSVNGGAGTGHDYFEVSGSATTLHTCSPGWTLAAGDSLYIILYLTGSPIHIDDVVAIQSVAFVYTASQ